VGQTEEITEELKLYDLKDKKDPKSFKLKYL
jgi:hypothetical protein